MEITIKFLGKSWGWTLLLPNGEVVMGTRADAQTAWKAAWDRWVRFEEEG